MISNTPAVPAGLIREPWVLWTGRHRLLVRPSGRGDLAALARMHRRCSARSLLNRYRRGGCAPAVAALEIEVRNPYSVVAVGIDGEVVAAGAVRRDPAHGGSSAELGLLVEDRWQRQGIGTDLAGHLAGVAYLTGVDELIAYPATAPGVAQRLMTDIGRSRLILEPEPHLHTALTRSAELGLGAVRRRLAG